MSDDGWSGPQRVAAFLLSLDREAAGEVLRHLGEDVLPDVAEAMAELDPRRATRERVDALYKELLERARGPRAVRPVPRDALPDVLASSLGEERSSHVLGTLKSRRMHERPFADVEKHPPGAIAQVLQSESPAVAALVLAHLEPALSAAVLGCYDSKAALDVVRRMTALKPPGFRTLEAIALDLAEQLESEGDDGGGAAPDPAERLQTIAEMLSHSGEAIEKAVLEGLETEMSEVAKEIRDNMFTWEDLAAVDKRAMQKILGSVNTKTLSIALKASPPAVEENILANLSSRVRDMVSEERELAGAMPLTEVQAAREEILQAVRAMMEAGEFRPTRAGEDLVT